MILRRGVEELGVKWSSVGGPQPGPVEGQDELGSRRVLVIGSRLG